MSEPKLCECGCGQPASIAKRNNPLYGHVKGQPVRFRPGHQNRRGQGQAIRDYPEASAYYNARYRCTNPKSKAYHRYGGRKPNPIEFRFKSFWDFLDEVGPRPSPRLQIERRDNNGHYEVGNLYWATRAQQQANRERTHSEVGLSIAPRLRAIKIAYWASMRKAA
jgi:hypothetical protein